MTGITKKPNRLGDYITCHHFNLDLPSPATSGYSDMDSEADTHDSGRVSEVESSPKLTHQSRVPCPTVHMSTDTQNYLRSRSIPGDSTELRKPKAGRDGSVVIDVGMLKALLVCVRENRSRLADAEMRLRNADNAMMTMQNDFQSRVLELTDKILEVQANCALHHRANNSCQAKHIETRDASDDFRLNEAVNHDITTSNGQPLYAVVRKPPKRDCSSGAESSDCDCFDNEAHLDLEITYPDDDVDGDKSDTLKAVTTTARAVHDPYSTIDSSDDDCASQETPVVGSPTSKSTIDVRSHFERLTESSSAPLSFPINRSVDVSPVKNSEQTFTPSALVTQHAWHARHCDVTSRNSAQLNSSLNSNCTQQQQQQQWWWQTEEPRVVQSASSHKSLRSVSDTRVVAVPIVAPRKFPSMENIRPAAIVHKLRRKFKGKRGKLGRGESMDSVGTGSVSGESEINSPVHGDVNEGYEFGHNNNCIVPPTKLKTRKSILSYSVRPLTQQRPSLDSIGNEADADSMRSVDVSETFGNHRDVEEHCNSIAVRKQAPLPALPVAEQRGVEDVDGLYSTIRSVREKRSVSEPPCIPSALHRPTELFVLDSNGYSVYHPTDPVLEDVDAGDDVFDKRGVILTDVERQQEERRRLGSGGAAAWQPDEPPPKPSRPGFPGPGSRAGYPPQGGAAGYPPPTQPGMYASSRPVVPPKAAPKLMSAEEIKRQEAEEKLRLKQLEEENIEQKLAHQKLQAEEDDRWLQQEEQLLHPEQPQPNGDEAFDPDHVYQSADEMRKMRAAGGSRSDMEAPPPPSMAPAKPPRNPQVKEIPQPPMPKLNLEEVKPTPTMKIDRNGDAVYRDTMKVVKAVLQTNQETMSSQPDDLFALVKNIGVALKQLCNSLEEEMKNLPEIYHREIDMAQKTTNKDLSQIINQVKLVKRFFDTTQVTQYKKCMMAATQVLAIDAKNLLDVVDKARINRNAGESSGQWSDDGDRHVGFEGEMSLPPPPSELLEQG